MLVFVFDLIAVGWAKGEKERIKSDTLSAPQRFNLKHTWDGEPKWVPLQLLLVIWV